MTKLKIGDNVVMNDRYYDKHQGEVFTIKAGPQMIGRKECFWLDGYDGAYCADGLDLYKPPTNEEWFCKLPTEEKAKVFANATYSTAETPLTILWGGKEAEQKKWEMWLKQPHTPIS